MTALVSGIAIGAVFGLMVGILRAMSSRHWFDTEESTTTTESEVTE